jgi:YtkA-like
MKKNSGLQWPIGISIAIIGVVALGVWTIKETAKEPVEESDIYMHKYQEVDDNANDFINARIAFDKKYSINYIGNKLDINDSKIIYKITSKENNNSINDAKIKVVLTRPQTHNQDTTLGAPTVKDGVYSFETKLPGKGRWDVMASIIIGKDKRYYNLKMDTQSDKKPVEY